MSVQELRRMYGQPPATGPKPPTTAKPLGSRWNAGNDSSTNPPAPAKSSFLHAAKNNPWAQNASKTSDGTDHHSTSNRPAIAPKKPWEQNKPAENDARSAFNKFKNTEEESSKPDPPWLKNSGVKKAPSFSSPGFNKPEFGGVKKTTSFSAQNNYRPGNFRKPEPSQNSATEQEDTTKPSWMKSRQENQSDKSLSNQPRTHFTPNNFQKPQETPPKPSWGAKPDPRNDEPDENEPAVNSITKTPSFLAKANAFNELSKESAGASVTRNQSFGERKFGFNKPVNDSADTNVAAGATSANRFATNAPKTSPKGTGDGAMFGGTISRDKRSFLHNRSADTTSSAGSVVPTEPVVEISSPKERRKRTIPADVYNRPPPAKPRKPRNAKLPGENPQSSINAPSSTSLQKRGSFNTGLPPSPSPTSFLSAASNNQDLPRPPSPAKLRNLPPTPSRQPAPSPVDDVYDDTTAVTGSADDVIPTWDDEEPEQIYDETPDEGAPAVPERIEEESDNDDMYEDLDQYQKFKGRTNGAPLPPNPVVKEEKPKKEIDKKEKAMRKKFQLSLDGDVPVEGTGFIKNNVKGIGKMTLRANEKVDIIRRANNPKGKWLIRTENGNYGYTDPDNVNADPYVTRSGALPAAPTPQKQLGPPAVPPPLPGKPNSAEPPPIPPMGEEDEIEAIYDETPDQDDDVYEAL